MRRGCATRNLSLTQLQFGLDPIAARNMSTDLDEKMYDKSLGIYLNQILLTSILIDRPHTRRIFSGIGFSNLEPSGPKAETLPLGHRGLLQHEGDQKEQRSDDIGRNAKKIQLNCKYFSNFARLRPEGGRGGLVARSRPRDRRATGPKHDSTEDPLCMGPVARQIILIGQTPSRWCSAEAWRGGASPGVVLII
ncbi:hypothetical protein AVEN_24022-1 [Araneus ventricosus]|uniref:Uncharacterized protein n=1 Tax=Araneus ventricosus TaxID=182803 RepID=A0A4Y2D011_ARAVE|nr:hypothetical protein AVEN_24022-1 [Araneus ventricosus]